MKKITNKTASILTRKTITGFTLAEVLITLLIIGVVASLVIPNLITDTQEHEYKVAWKKAYSNIEQVMRMARMDNGGNLDVLYNEGDKLANYYLKYFNYSKRCSGSGTCWHGSFGTWKWLNGQPEMTYGNPQASAILTNGNLLFICGDFIIVDINGFKSPNTAGKDIYFIRVKSNSIQPYGIQGDGYENTCNSGNSGMGCSAKYLMQ